MIDSRFTLEENLAGIASTIDMVCKFMEPAVDGKPVYLSHELQEKLYGELVETRDNLVSLIGGVHA